jgi:hypothetical protein
MQRFWLVVAVSLTAAGCSHAQVQLNAGGATTASGGGGSSAAALIGLGIAGAVIYSSERSGPPYGVRYNSNPFMAVTDSARAPQLAPERRVNEQDCTQPITDFSANLKCR